MLIFDIEVNMHNKNLGRISFIRDEILDRLAPEQYGVRKENPLIFKDLTPDYFTTLSERIESQRRVYSQILSIIMNS